MKTKKLSIAIALLAVAVIGTSCGNKQQKSSSDTTTCLLYTSSSTTANGKRTHSLDANITAITRIPKARLIISCKLEASLIKRSQNLSEYNGKMCIRDRVRQNGELLSFVEVQLF